MRLLEQRRIEVGCDGELVRLAIGNVSVSMEFPLALQVAAALRHHARIAKLNSGRDERGIHVLGLLQDAAAAGGCRRKRFGERLPELLHPRGIDVKVEGQIVLLTFGRVEAGFPYDGARELAQWLRVRGKEAKRNAGEREHWSRINGVAAAAAGERAFR